MDTQIHQGKSVTLKKCTYTGYCASIWSVENAIQILDQIGLTSDSEDCLPFAIRLVEGGELVQIAEDNGEFGCGDVLAECLSKVDKYNVLVCVSRRIRDSCVLDMHQRMKLIVVKEAGMNAVNVIHAHLSNQEKVRERSEMMKMPVDIPEPPTSSRPAEDRPAFPIHRVPFDPTIMISSETQRNETQSGPKTGLSTTKRKLLETVRRSRK